MKKYYAGVFFMFWMLSAAVLASDGALLETGQFKEALSDYDVAVNGGSGPPCMEYLQDALIAFNALERDDHIRVCFYKERLFHVAAQICLAMPGMEGLGLLQHHYYMVMMRTFGERGRQRFWEKWRGALMVLGYESVMAFEARVPQSKVLPGGPGEAAAAQAEYDRVFEGREEMEYDWICAYYYPSESDGDDSNESLHSLSDASSLRASSDGSFYAGGEAAAP